MDTLTRKSSTKYLRLASVAALFCFSAFLCAFLLSRKGSEAAAAGRHSGEDAEAARLASIYAAASSSLPKLEERFAKEGDNSAILDLIERSSSGYLPQFDIVDVEASAAGSPSSLAVTAEGQGSWGNVTSFIAAGGGLPFVHSFGKVELSEVASSTWKISATINVPLLNEPSSHE